MPKIMLAQSTKPPFQCHALPDPWSRQTKNLGTRFTVNFFVPFPTFCENKRCLRNNGLLFRALSFVHYLLTVHICITANLL